jgi:mannose-6-phosphate isomerase-like protein (cupin superfamily)
MNTDPSRGVESDNKPQIARFSELQPFKTAFLDSYLSAHEKENFRIIGSGVFEDPSARPVIKGLHGFSLGMIRCEPGKGAALHSHQTMEVFIPLNGSMMVVYGENGEKEEELKQWDVASIPVGLMRGFRNPNDFPVLMVGVVTEKDPGRDRVTWHPAVVEAARLQGVRVDDSGNLLPRS